MKTKREVLEEIVEKGHCIDIMCSECPYNPSSYCAIRLRKVGAMAILRMFPEKKKPLLFAGAKIRFDNGKLYIIEKRVDSYNREEYCLRDKNTMLCYSIDCLIDKTWEVVE